MQNRNLEGRITPHNAAQWAATEAVQMRQRQRSTESADEAEFKALAERLRAQKGRSSSTSSPSHVDLAVPSSCIPELFQDDTEFPIQDYDQAVEVEQRVDAFELSIEELDELFINSLEPNAADVTEAHAPLCDGMDNDGRITTEADILFNSIGEDESGPDGKTFDDEAHAFPQSSSWAEHDVDTEYQQDSTDNDKIDSDTPIINHKQVDETPSSLQTDEEGDYAVQVVFDDTPSSLQTDKEGDYADDVPRVPGAVHPHYDKELYVTILTKMLKVVIRSHNGPANRQEIKDIMETMLPGFHRSHGWLWESPSGLIISQILAHNRDDFRTIKPPNHPRMWDVLGETNSPGESDDLGE